MDALSQQSANQAPQFVLANSQEESSFDFWGVLNRRKWLVFLGLVTGLALGGLYHAQCEEIYESEAKVKIEPKNPTIFRLTNTDVVGPNMNDFATRHDRFIGQYNLVNKCLKSQGLMELSSFDDLPEGDVVDYVIDNLNVSPDREEPVIFELSFRCRTPEDSQTVLNNLISTYREELDSQYKSESDKYTALLKRVETQFSTNYERLQAELNETLKGNLAPILVGGMNIHQIAVRDFGKAMQVSRDRLTILAADRVRAKEAIGRSRQDIETLLWNLAEEQKLRNIGLEKENTEFGKIQLNITSLEIERSELKERLGPNHPQVRALTGTIDSWRKYLEGTDGGMGGPEPEMILQRYLMSLDQQIRDEQGMLDQYTNEYIAHDAEAIKVADVQRKIDIIKEQMNDVKEMMKMAQMKIVEVDPSMELNNRARHEGFIFENLMDATYGKVVWPILPIILGIGGLLGTLAGFGLGCLVELADKTFHNPDEIMKQLQVPLIGHIPVIGQSKRYLVENSLIEPIVCTYHRPRSQVSESFRAVRTSLYFNTQGKQHSVIQITSPTPGDGKSTLASNLAVSIAQSGKRVLLVDGDMRRPRQGATFGITSKTGFATVLSGESQWRDVVYECEEIEGLTVMPCGAKPNNPAELSSSPQVKELIEEMRLEFDFVVIDTPPLLAVTDACPIAARVDGVILCLRIKKNVRVSAERATEMLANLGANCIGLVVNGVGAQSGYGSQYTYGAYRAGYSYNGYGYGYGYGYGSGKYYDENKSDTATRAPVAPKHIEAQRTE